jgi:hypothetical protein
MFEMVDNLKKLDQFFLIIDYHHEIEHNDDDFDNNLLNHNKNKYLPL